MYLWLPPTLTMGGSAVALVLAHRTGTRVLGVAGFDLWGTSMLVGTGVGLPFVFAYMGTSLPQALWPSLLMMAVMLTRAWLHHDADPLVRFLERIAQPSGSQKRFHLFTLSIDGRDEPKPPTPRELEAALEDMQTGGFLIASAADEIYMQIARLDDGFLIERREGDGRSHFRASQSEDRQVLKEEAVTTFSLDVTRRTLLAYVEGRELPATLAWRRVEFPEMADRF